MPLLDVCYHNKGNYRFAAQNNIFSILSVVYFLHPELFPCFADPRHTTIDNTIMKQ